MAERGCRLQRQTCSLLVSPGESHQLVVFPKQAITGFEEVEELTGPFTLMKLLTLYVMYIYV